MVTSGQAARRFRVAGSGKATLETLRRVVDALAPAEFRREVSDDAADQVGVVVDAELVGDGEQQEVTGARDRRGLEGGDAGEQRLGPGSRGVGLGSHC